TTEVCNDTITQTKTLIQSLTTSVGALAANPSPSTDQQQQAITAVKQTFTNIAKLWRQEAGTASDSGLASALNKAADQVDAANAKIPSSPAGRTLATSSFDSSDFAPSCRTATSTQGGAAPGPRGGPRGGGPGGAHAVSGPGRRFRAGPPFPGRATVS